MGNPGSLSSLASLVATGTKLWVDSVDPLLVDESFKKGATGATSNPIIIADLIKTGRFDKEILAYASEYKKDRLDRDLLAQKIAWAMTNQLVGNAEEVFLKLFHNSQGDDGYVSFEVDPLLEDLKNTMPLTQKIEQYIEQGLYWAKDHPNRMIKVPATEAGLGALEELAFSGIPLNVTLIFTKRQYRLARQKIWTGAQRRRDLSRFKSVYSIFVSRLDVYTEKHLPKLSPQAQGLVGIVNAKEIWLENRDFWREHPTPLKQEIVFASTGTKKPEDPSWKYVAAFAGSDIETNPPGTNQAVELSGKQFSRTIDLLPPAPVVSEIHSVLDPDHMESTLMAEGLAKFAEPQKALIQLIKDKITSI